MVSRAWWHKHMRDRDLSHARREALAVGFPVLNTLAQYCVDWSGKLPEAFVPLLNVLITKAAIPQNSRQVCSCSLFVTPGCT
jgi:hypothetical protein